MKQDYTHLCIILDASGSMESIRSETIKNFNAFLETQKKESGITIVDLFQFNDNTERVVTKANLAQYHSNLHKKYQCDGCTALYDAICIGVDTLGKEFSAMQESERPANVMVAIITDGYENASRRFSQRDAFDRIKLQRDVYSWEFVFLAANQDSFLAGEQIGMNKQDCYDFTADDKGMKEVCECLCERADRTRQRKR